MSGLCVTRAHVCSGVLCKEGLVPRDLPPAAWTRPAFPPPGPSAQDSGVSPGRPGVSRPVVQHRCPPPGAQSRAGSCHVAGDVCCCHWGAGRGAPTWPLGPGPGTSVFLFTLPPARPELGSVSLRPGSRRQIRVRTDARPSLTRGRCQNKSHETDQQTHVTPRGSAEETGSSCVNELS